MWQKKKFLATCFRISFMTLLSNFSQRERKKILLISSVAVVLLLCWIVFSTNGALHYYKIFNELKAVRAENQQLQKQNKALREEIDKLLKDPEYIEEVARKKYGFIKENEIIFDFEKKKKN